MSLTQEEFEYILNLKKRFQQDDEILLGPAPINWSRDIVSLQSKDMFTLDFYRGSIELKKYTLNKRYRTAIVLLRYDSQGRHTNPPGTDGAAFTGPHVHIYREGFDDKWAFPVTEIGLEGNEEMPDVVKQFLTYCNIQEIPIIQSSLC